MINRLLRALLAGAWTVAALALFVALRAVAQAFHAASAARGLAGAASFAIRHATHAPLLAGWGVVTMALIAAVVTTAFVVARR